MSFESYMKGRAILDINGLPSPIFLSEEAPK
jgi:hypothetical protein